MTLHPVGLLKSDAGLAWQPLITQGFGAGGGGGECGECQGWVSDLLETALSSTVNR